ncbi:hypothetical protein E2C01_045947 [Portunus trituberculatus]|uniref:Uncharacterized protein n=1 Tax=Portunus trituberculatus TaxID=210409 RepID=A0A5B7G3C1_PORTR|nr:hypothetical protein [Portunus trituberculatus]
MSFRSHQLSTTDLAPPAPVGARVATTGGGQLAQADMLVGQRNTASDNGGGTDWRGEGDECMLTKTSRIASGAANCFVSR